MASQTNRLVLVHFWAEWCKPCAEMEREVFSRQNVVAAIEAGFVPVKVNVDHFPAKVRQYGVSIIPTDVILTPDGQLVDKLIGSVDASQYVARLNQITQSRGGQAETGYARQKVGQPATPAYQQPATPAYGQPAAPAYNQPTTPAYGQPATPAYQQPLAGGGHQTPGNQSPAPSSNNRYPNYYGGRTQPEKSPGAPGLADRTSTGADHSPYGPPPPMARPAYGGGQSTAGSDTTPRYQPPGSAYQGGATTPPYGGAAAPYRNDAASPYDASSATRDDMDSNASHHHTNSTTPHESGTTTGYGIAPTVPQESVPSSREPDTAVERPLADQLPPGSPPLALDGFCPVRLSEQEHWVQGDVRWGARHKGRTYLFSGPEEQQRFLDAPEKYAPAHSGYDVVLAVQQGQEVPGRREHGVWYRGKVYLFSSEASVEQFRASPEQYVFSLEQMASGTARRPVIPAPTGATRQTLAPSCGRRY